MEIVLALLRTLVFVVATIAATVYVSRRIGRGRPLLWTGTTLLALYWLVLFGWTSYLTGTTNPSPDLAIWVGWGGHLLPFFAALAYIWGIGQAAGFPSRAGAGAGAAVGAKNSKRPSETVAAGGGAAAPVTQPEAPSAPASTTSSATAKDAPKPFPGPHTVPVETTPSSASPYGQGEPKTGQAKPGKTSTAPGASDGERRPSSE